MMTTVTMVAISTSHLDRPSVILPPAWKMRGCEFWYQLISKDNDQCSASWNWAISSYHGMLKLAHLPCLKVDRTSSTKLTWRPTSGFPSNSPLVPTNAQTNTMLLLVWGEIQETVWIASDWHRVTSASHSSWSCLSANCGWFMPSSIDLQGSIGICGLLWKLMLLSSKSLSHVSCCKRKHLPRLPHTRDRMNPWMQNKKGNAWKCDVYIYIYLGKCQRFETSKYVENQIISNYDVSPWEMGLNMVEPLLPKHCEAVLFFIAVSHTSSLGACSNCETRCQLDQLAASRTLRA